MSEQKANFNLKKFSTFAGLGVALATILLYGTQTWKLIFPNPETPQANNFVYTGKVLDAKTKLPIKDALVEIQANGVPQSFLTTNNGIFRFNFDRKAIADRFDITLIVIASDYEQYRELRTLLINEKDIHDVYLERVHPFPPPLDTTKNSGIISGKRPLHYNLTINAIAGAEIWIDGINKGTKSVSLNIAEGEHTITVKKDSLVWRTKRTFTHDDFINVTQKEMQADK